MKTYLTVTAWAFGFLVPVFLLISFAETTIDFTEWRQDSRTMLMASGLFLLVISFVANGVKKISDTIE